MRVAIDGRRLQDTEPGGVGRYLSNVLPLVTNRSDLDVVLLTDGHRPPAPIDVDQAPLCAPSRAPGVAWLDLAAAPWLRQRRVLFHGAFNAIPLCCPVPSVVTFYDLAWENHPEDFSLAKRRVWQLYGRRAARGAARVITISAFIRDEIAATYPVKVDRIDIARCAVAPCFGPEHAAGAPAISARLGLSRPYVVAFGGARRRGLPEAVEAWRVARKAGHAVSLAVVGREQVQAEPGIVHLGRLDDGALAAVLAGAHALIYPTRYEGYGLPAHEAVASGTPVVCARTGPLPEILGPHAAWCENPTGAELGTALTGLLDDPGRWQAIRAGGLQQSGRLPSWKDAADTIAESYHRAAHEARYAKRRSGTT